MSTAAAVCEADRESQSVRTVRGCGIRRPIFNTGYALVAYIELLGADGVPRIAQGLAVSAAGLLSCLPILSVKCICVLVRGVAREGAQTVVGGRHLLVGTRLLRGRRGGC